MWALMLGMFFLPFGYDALFKLVMDWSGSYWIADLVFYGIAGTFFMIHWTLEGTFGRVRQTMRKIYCWAKSKIK